MTNHQPGDVESLVERLKDPNYAGPMQHLRSWSKIDALFSQAASTLSALEQENVRLRDALRPFAEAAESTDANDDYSSATIWEHSCALDITIGNLRQARRTLTEVQSNG